MKFRLSESGAPADLDTLVDTRLLVQANSGGGKSWCIRRLLEQTHGHVQHLVIDPEGEFSSLRERYDYVLAARHGGDTGVDPRAARLLAERLLELGVSAILDIYELKAHDRVRFVRQFLEALVDAPKKLWHPAIVVVDEAHVFCPQVGEAESAGAVIDLATRGRKRGFCAVLATQRLSKLHKDAAAECNNKLIGRTGLDVDVKRAADELGLLKERWRELRDLTPGEFFAFGPALSREVVKLKTGPVETKHPKAGARLAAVVPPATAKIRALLPKLADLPAEVEQKAKTEADLRKEVAELKRELRAAGEREAAPMVEIQRVEVPVLDAGGTTAIAHLREAAASLKDTAQLVAEAALRAGQTEARLLATTPKQHAPGPPARVTGSAGVPRVTKTPATHPTGNGKSVPSDWSSGMERILRTIATLNARGIEVGRETVARWLALHPNGGRYNRELAALRAQGFLDGFRLTKDVVPPDDTGLDAALEALPDETKRRTLRAVIEADRTLSREELAGLLGLHPNGGRFNRDLAWLRTMGLIPERGAIQLTPGATA